MLSNTLQIEQLKLQLAKLRRKQFGRSSEQLDAQIAQLELTLEDLEVRSAATSLSLLAIPAASISKCASCFTTFMRSTSVNSRVSLDSNAMVFCRGIWAGGTGLLRNLVASDILLLLGSGDITAGASPKSARLEQSMQINQCIRRDAWRPDLHRRANPGVEHPLGKYGYDARFDLNVDDASAGAMLAVVGSNTPSEERMPRIVNYNFSPDMGRMTA